MNTIKQNLVNVRSHIDTAAQKCGRSPDEITLLAVSKTKPVSDIEK
ncbi:YggS family pyridoxal phosphate enzyme, partial [Proteus mirabilis]